MNESKTFCMHPFTGLATREDGAIKLCCRSSPIGDITKESLEDIWNNDSMKRVRKQVLNGERPSECEPCFSVEDQGVESLRQRHNSTIFPDSRTVLFPEYSARMREDYTMPFDIPTMELKMNNLCNLKCRMCNPVDSTSWNDWKEIEPFFVKENNFMVKIVADHNLMNKPYLDKFEDNANWWESFEKLLPTLRKLDFAGGEPLMDPQHYKILEMLEPHASNISLKYATNMSTLGKGKRSVMNHWPKFKDVAVNVSIDGIESSYEYIRGNSDWKVMIANIKTVQGMGNIKRVIGATCVQATNALILDKIIEYTLDELGIIFWCNFLRYPNVLSAQVLPPELKLLAVDRLITAKSKIHSYRLIKQQPELLPLISNEIDNIINYIQGEDHYDKWLDYLEFNRRLDKTRSQGPVQMIIPEFKPYV